VTTCPDHNPIWIPSGALCLACLVFYPTPGRELKPSYRPPATPTRRPAAAETAGLFEEGETEGGEGL